MRDLSDVHYIITINYNQEPRKLPGRPGWHIECSTIIDKHNGQCLDVHIGGIDLKFPHHFNEIIQANAYNHPMYLDNNNKWCKEFYHIGHLNSVRIGENGELVNEKMSKSLKNFTTIRETLKKCAPNAMRWIFFNNNWRNPINFSDNIIEYGSNIDAKFSSFFEKIDSCSYNYTAQNVKLSNRSEHIHELISKNKHEISNHTKDLNFHNIYPLLSELMKSALSYINTTENYNVYDIRKINNYLRKYLKKMGFDYAKTSCGEESKNKMNEVMNVLITTRTKIRQFASDKSIDKNIVKKIYEILDSERNHDLKNIGIILEDQKSNSVWFLDAQTIH